MRCQPTLPGCMLKLGFPSLCTALHCNVNVSVKQESIPVGCVPPAFLVRGVGSDQPPVDADSRLPL